MEKLKAYGIAIGIAVISILLIVLRQRDSRLKAAEYQLKIIKVDAQVKDIKVKLAELGQKTSIGMKALAPRLEALKNKLGLLEQEKDRFEKARNSILDVLATKSNTSTSGVER